MSKPFYVKFEVPKELTEAAYEALQVALDTGKVKKGTNETTKAVERGIAKLVYIAEDVQPPEIVAHLPLLCDEMRIQYIYVPSKNRLGMSINIPVGSAAASIIDPGDANDLVQEILSRLNTIIGAETQ
jgi:large subunit ribosomal protein L7Ae